MNSSPHELIKAQSFNDNYICASVIPYRQRVCWHFFSPIAISVALALFFSPLVIVNVAPFLAYVQMFLLNFALSMKK